MILICIMSPCGTRVLCFFQISKIHVSQGGAAFQAFSDVQIVLNNPHLYQDNLCPCSPEPPHPKIVDRSGSCCNWRHGSVLQGHLLVLHQDGHCGVEIYLQYNNYTSVNGIYKWGITVL